MGGRSVTWTQTRRLRAAGLVFGQLRMMLLLVFALGVLPFAAGVVYLLVRGIGVERVTADVELMRAIRVTLWLWALYPLCVGTAIAVEVLWLGRRRRSIRVGARGLAVDGVERPWPPTVRVRVTSALGLRFFRIRVGRIDRGVSLAVPPDVDDAELRATVAEIRAAAAGRSVSPA